MTETAVVSATTPASPRWALGGSHGQAQQGHRVYHDVDAYRGEHPGRQKVCLAELRHVGNDGRSYGSLELFQFAGPCERFRENKVGAGVEVGLCAGYGPAHALGRSGVGACTYHKAGVPPGSRCGCDPPAHLVNGDNLFAVEVAAAFGVHLVLHLHTRRPELLEHVDGAGDVERLAEARVGVHQAWQGGDSSYLVSAAGNLALGHEPDVR